MFADWGGMPCSVGEILVIAESGYSYANKGNCEACGRVVSISQQPYKGADKSYDPYPPKSVAASKK